jgi:lysozyme
VSRYVKSKINSNQFSALVSFAFNLGVGNLAKSTLLKLVNKNPSDPAINLEFMKWNKANGKVLAGLTRRRQAESELYFK